MTTAEMWCSRLHDGEPAGTTASELADTEGRGHARCVTPPAEVLPAGLGGVGMRAHSGELATVDDQVFVADRPAVEVALEDLPGARAQRVWADSDPEMWGVMPWWGIVRHGWSAGAGCGYQTSPA